MSDILDQEELDALMADAQTQASAAPDVADAPRGGGERYDFASQDYVVHRLIPTMSQVQAQFAEALKQRLRNWVPSVESVRTDKVAVLKHGELMRSMEPPQYILAIEAQPLGAPIYVEFDAKLVFLLVDFFYGGRGKGTPPAIVDFSASELRFMERLSDGILHDLKGAWNLVVALEPSITARHTDYRHLEELRPNDTLMMTRMIVTIADQEADMSVIVPWTAIDPLRERLSGQGRATSSRQEVDARWRRLLLAGLHDAQLELVARLSETQVSLKRVTSMKVGDVLPIESPEQVMVTLEGLSMLSGRFGSQQGQLCVQVEEIEKTLTRKSRY